MNGYTDIYLDYSHISMEEAIIIIRCSKYMEISGVELYGRKPSCYHCELLNF